MSAASPGAYVTVRTTISPGVTTYCQTSKVKNNDKAHATSTVWVVQRRRVLSVKLPFILNELNSSEIDERVQTILRVSQSQPLKLPTWISRS